jgi:hypothetical protein
LSLGDFFRKLFANRPAPQTEESSLPEGTHVTPVAPPESGVPPTAPLDRPAVDDEGPPPTE